MYFSAMLTVAKAENGFVIEAQVPLKKKDAKGKGSEPVCCGPTPEKHYIAKTAEEAGKYIASMLPLLEEEYSGEKEFDSAFDECMGDDK